MATKKQEHNARVLENEINRIKWHFTRGSVSWHVMEKPWRDRYRCLVCNHYKFNHNFYNVYHSYQYVWAGELVKDRSKLGKVCSSTCWDETKVRYNESDKLEVIENLNGFDKQYGIIIEFEPNKKLHYVCKGCRKRKKLTDPLITIGYQAHDVDDDPEDKSYTYFFGRVCSEECYTLMTLKMQQ